MDLKVGGCFQLVNLYDNVTNLLFSTELCVGDLEITPVSAAIASYLGIDLSLEGKAARNRRGICIIVHGAPLSGKTATATELAMKYQTALISIDEVVEQAIQYGRSSAGMSDIHVVCYTMSTYYIHIT